MKVTGIKVALALTTLAKLWAPIVAAQDIVIADVDLISMLEPGVQADRNVTIRDGKIVAISQGDVAPGARVIDGDGRYLIPGLAEMHAHVPVDAAYRDDVLFLWAANGVTTARGMLGHPTHLSLREDLLAHRALGRA